MRQLRILEYRKDQSHQQEAWSCLEYQRQLKQRLEIPFHLAWQWKRMILKQERDEHYCDTFSTDTNNKTFLVIEQEVKVSS